MVKNELISTISDGSIIAIGEILKSQNTNIDEEIKTINEMDHKFKYEFLCNNLKTVMENRIENFLNELKLLTGDPVFNNNLAREMINAECNLIAIETIKLTGNN